MLDNHNKLAASLTGFAHNLAAVGDTPAKIRGEPYVPGGALVAQVL